MITKLHFENYRAFVRSDLELGPLTLLIGPNGSGKSTILTALDGLKDIGHIARPDVHTVFARESELTRVCVHYRESSGFVTWDVSGIAHRGVQAMFREKQWDGPGREDFDTLVNQFNYQIRRFEFDVPRMRGGVQVSQTRQLASDGSDLAGFIDYIRDNSTERFQAVENALFRATDQFDRIGFDRPQEGHKSLKLRRAGTTQFISAAQLSEGTLLLLALLALAYQPDPPTMVCIEEPDRGIHPRLYPQVREALYRLAYPKDFKDDREPVQVVATTHSPYFLNLFNDHPEEVVVCERDTKSGVVFRNLGRDERARDLLHDTVLGDAWFTGALGGVPARS